jgi:hypothetical protein
MCPTCFRGIATSPMKSRRTGIAVFMNVDVGIDEAAGFMGRQSQLCNSSDGLEPAALPLDIIVRFQKPVGITTDLVPAETESRQGRVGRGGFMNQDPIPIEWVRKIIIVIVSKLFPAGFPSRPAACTGEPLDFIDSVDGLSPNPLTGRTDLQRMPVRQGLGCDAQQHGGFGSAHILPGDVFDRGHGRVSIHLI